MLKLKQAKVISVSIFVLSSFLVPCIAEFSASPAANREPVKELAQKFQRRRPRGENIRRGGLCAVSPGTDGSQDQFVIWSDRPLFMWQMNPNQIAVQRLKLVQVNTEEILWDKSLPDAAQSVAYEGKPLQPGQVYSWELVFKRNNSDPILGAKDTLEYRFQVMDANQRQRVTVELQTLGDRVKKTGASPETIAMEQAQYFEDQGLSSDALQVLHSIKSPSTETKNQIRALVTSVCGDSNPASKGVSLP